MINNSVIQLEDGNDYAVVEKISLVDKAYVYLTNIKDMEDFCVRKEIKKGEDEEQNYLVGLDDDQEFEEAMRLFIEKNSNEA
ncbi:MAG: hypothetical protein PUB18_04390 [bacterium]|nr:hypothetical protein [bacterium]